MGTASGLNKPPCAAERPAEAPALDLLIFLLSVFLRPYDPLCFYGPFPVDPSVHVAVVLFVLHCSTTLSCISPLIFVLIQTDRRRPGVSPRHYLSLHCQRGC